MKFILNLLIILSLLFQFNFSINNLQINNEIQCWNDHGSWSYNKKLINIVNKKSCSKNRYNSDQCESLTNNGSSSINHNHYHYHWYVDNSKCNKKFNRWSFDEMCLLLANESVMMVGDSLQEEFYFSLLSSVWKYNDPATCNPSPIETIKCGGISSTSDSFKVSFIRNDYLSLTTTNTDTEHEWITKLDLYKTTILILNKGAHYKNDDEMISNLKITLSYVQNNYPHIQIFYRSTVPGHLNYQQYFNSFPIKEFIIDKDVQGTYHYSEFLRQNEETKNILRMNFEEVIYFDIYNSTVLRADSHADPLHYCIPGPLDHWVRTFFNVLYLFKQKLIQTEKVMYDINDHPILYQWNDDKSSIDKCGNFSDWFNEYIELHKSILNNNSPNKLPRVLISLFNNQGAIDRLVGIITEFFAAMFSKRAFLFKSLEKFRSFDYIFDFPINLTVPFEIENKIHNTKLSDEDTSYNESNEVTYINIPNGFPIFHESYPAWATTRIFGTNQIALIHSNRGGIFNLMKNTNYSSFFQKMKFQPNYCMYCVFHFLLKPKKNVLDLAYPIAHQLTKDVIKIGIQIRSGDKYIKLREEINDFDMYNNFFDCAEQIETSGKIPTNKKIIWFLVSDSLPLRIHFKSKYGDKLITDTVFIPSHLATHADNTTLPLLMSDVLTLSLCDYFILTHNSGVGKVGALLSPNLNISNVYIVAEGNCHNYPVLEDIFYSNQGI